ncbi:basic region leucine zipper [Cooperia oncophora]
MTLHEDKPNLTALRTESNSINSSDRRVPCDLNTTLDPEKRSDFYAGFPQFKQSEIAANPDFVGGCVFERQDSLARAATLQECDRSRDPEGILNFLETTMNIEDYLEDITHMTGVPVDDLDLDDIELQKCNILYNDGKALQSYETYDPFAHSELLIREQLHPEAYAAPSPALAEVKKEPEWENSRPTATATRSSKRSTRAVQPLEPYVPTTTARKYRLKSPQERNNLSYKVKRQRNNDAVRRSRSKAKQLQMMKEKQLEDALTEVTELKEKLRVAQERLSRCRCRQ